MTNEEILQQKVNQLTAELEEEREARELAEANTHIALKSYEKITALRTQISVKFGTMIAERIKQMEWDDTKVFYMANDDRNYPVTDVFELDDYTNISKQKFESFNVSADDDWNKEIKETALELIKRQGIQISTLIKSGGVYGDGVDDIKLMAQSLINDDPQLNQSLT